MNTKPCPKCGNQIPEDALSCQHCGSILMQLGKSGERTISRIQALIWGIFLLLFPLCCTVSVSYRLITGEPPDYQALFSGGGTAETTLTSTPEEQPGDTPSPTDTETPVGEGTPTAEDPALEPSATLPAIAAADCIPENAERMVAEVVEVIDGDEIRVRVDGDEYRVRYIGLLAPEIAEDYGPEASNENVNLVLLKQVTLVRDVTDRDPEGLLPRYAFVGDLFVNQELLRRGLAIAENMPPDLACSDFFQQQEAAAKDDKAGLWETPPPDPTNTLAPLWTSTPAEVVCNCTGADLDCEDFATLRDARECYLKCLIRGHGDVYELDPNDNGIACDE